MADRVPYVADEPTLGQLNELREFLSREFKRVEAGFVGVALESGDYVSSATLSAMVGVSIQPYNVVTDILTAGAAGQVLFSNSSGVAASFQPLPGATTATAGIVEIATHEEVATGTDESKPPSVSSMASHQGVCKAWVNFNGSGTVAIRDSYNVSSITDNGTGDYTVNFTNDMGSINFAFAYGGRPWFLRESAKTVSSLRFNVLDSAAVLADSSDIEIIVFGA